jgi:RND family efflux transporter MFP subunit
LARKQLADTVVRAPFDGAIQARLANLGEFLPAGASVVTTVKTDPLRLRLEVPERSATWVRLGQAVRLQVEGETNLFSGVIARLSPALTEQNRMLVVEADVPNNGFLRPGLFARAKIVIDNKADGIAVPAPALVTFAGLEKVVVVRDGKAVEQTVTTGRRGSNWVEITSGLKVGESVVMNPGNLRTGQAVSIVDAASVQTSQAFHDSGP